MYLAPLRTLYNHRIPLNVNLSSMQRSAQESTGCHVTASEKALENFDESCCQSCWESGLFMMSDLLTENWRSFAPRILLRWVLSEEQMAASCQIWMSSELVVLSILGNCVWQTFRVNSSWPLNYKKRMLIHPFTKPMKSKKQWQDWGADRHLAFVTSAGSCSKLETHP